MFSSWDDLQIECSSIKYYKIQRWLYGISCNIRRTLYFSRIRIMNFPKQFEKIDPELILQYLCFRRMKAIHGIVELFPDYKRKFHFYREFLHKLIFQIYKTYLAKYVWKMEIDDNLYPEIMYCVM